MTKPTRIVYAADRVPSDDAALRAIEVLTGSRQLQIQSVFIRDSNLTRAATLSLTREVSREGTIRPLSPDNINAHFKATAERMRAYIERLAGQLGYAATFSEMEGLGLSAVEILGSAADFVAIVNPAPETRSAPHNRTLPRIRCRTTTLFVNEPWLSGTTVLIAYEGDQSSAALDVAERYALQTNRPLVLLTPSGLETTTLPPHHTVHKISGEWNEAAIASACRQLNAHLLVLGYSTSEAWESGPSYLINSTSCSILEVLDAVGTEGINSGRLQRRKSHQ